MFTPIFLSFRHTHFYAFRLFLLINNYKSRKYMKLITPVVFVVVVVVSFFGCVLLFLTYFYRYLYLLCDFSNWKFSWTAFDDNTGFPNIIMYMETALEYFPCHPLTFTQLFVHFANRNEFFPCSRLSCIVIHKFNLLSHSLR